MRGHVVNWFGKIQVIRYQVKTAHAFSSCDQLKQFISEISVVQKVPDYDPDMNIVEIEWFIEVLLNEILTITTYYPTRNI